THAVLIGHICFDRRRERAGRLRVDAVFMRTKIKAFHSRPAALSEPACIEGLIGRFYGPRRPTVRRLAYRSPRVADLAVTFPAALYALANRNTPRGRREQALSLIEAGAQLKDVAAALALPL